ncbi:hypothetical protein ACFYPC_29340 [Streptomyces sp. NPDC005808]|uniref:hypothetical protein n=1 Tax=Streptomyces sp. NPDC005808 TaxID=3364734 RepID=UPI00368AA0A9
MIPGRFGLHVHAARNSREEGPQIPRRKGIHRQLETEYLTPKRTKLLLIVGVISVLGLFTTAAYTFELPPFKKTGEIEASDVCASLGNRSHVVAALKDVLPDKSSYSFGVGASDLRTDYMDSSYRTDCFVYGDGEQLVWAGAELLEYDNTDQWVKDVVEQYDSASSLVPIASGDKAVASGKVAAIYFPCASQGGNRHLSVVVQLKRAGDASDAAKRAELIELANSAATYAYVRAKCDATSKLAG